MDSRDEQYLVVLLLFFLCASIFTLLFISTPLTVKQESLRVYAGLNYMDGTGHDVAFSRFMQDDLKYVSLRLYWDVVETSRGVYSGSGTNLYKNTVALAQQYNLSVNITFWTQFQSGAEDPSWVRSLPGYTYYFKAYDTTTKNAWLDWVEYMVRQLRGYSCIDSWSILNEPFYATTEQKNGFIDLFDQQTTLIKSLDNRPVTCRFTSSYTPASGQYPDSVYNYFDVMSTTIYNHPSDYDKMAARTDPTIYNSKWWMYGDTVTDCASRDLPLWVIEFGAAAGNAGYSSLTEEQQRKHYEDVLKIFSDDGVERAYAWAWRHSSPSSEDFNLWTGSRVYSCYYELLNYTGAPSPPEPPEPPPPLTYWLTLRSVGGGRTYPNGTLECEVGAYVGVQAQADTDWEFERWTLDGGRVYSTNPFITVVMDDNHELVAYFIPTAGVTEYTLTMSHGPGGYVTPGGTSVYTDGTVVTCRAFPSSGYSFEKWRLDGSDYATTATTTVTMSADHTLYASFNLLPPDTPPDDEPEEPPDEEPEPPPVMPDFPVLPEVTVSQSRLFDKVVRKFMCVKPFDMDLVVDKLKYTRPLTFDELIRVLEGAGLG